jgi:hypothetical protein
MKKEKSEEMSNPTHSLPEATSQAPRYSKSWKEAWKKSQQNTGVAKTPQATNPVQLRRGVRTGERQGSGNKLTDGFE